MKVEEMELTVRTYHCLKRAGIDTTEELEARKNELPKIRGLGKRTYDEIRDKMGWVEYKKPEVI